MGRRIGPSGVHHGGSRIRTEVMKGENLHPPRFERSHGLLSVTRFHHARISHQETLAPAEFARDFPQSGKLAGTEHHTRARTKIEWCHSPSGALLSRHIRDISAMIPIA